MGLERSIVFRKLDENGQMGLFSLGGRLAFEDVLPPLLGYAVVFGGGLIFDYHFAYAVVTCLALGVGMYLLRTRFPEGLFGLLEFLQTPKHLSAHAGDSTWVPYPASFSGEVRK